MTKAQREHRARVALEALRAAWRGAKKPDRYVRVTLQQGRKRPRVSGYVVYVSTTGSYVLLDLGDGDDPLHVPLDVVASVG
jgi:predicted metal-dependent RNase